MYQANETTVNDAIDVQVNISKEELTYRSKNFHELRSLKDRDAICCSCGNKLNVKLGNLFAHPIICILQCEACHSHIKKSFLTSTKQNRNQYCCFCGCSKNLHHCKKQQCEYAFCRPCIKRNSTLSLLDVDKNNWLCFLCDTKPLWKARGICATVLDTLLMNKNKRSEKTVIELDNHDSSGESNQQSTVQAMSRKNNDRTVATKKVLGTQAGKDDSIQIGSDDSEEIVIRRTQRTRNSKGDEKKLYFEKNQKNNISSSEEIEAEEEIPRVKRRRRLSSSSHRRSKVMQQTLNDEDSKSSSGREFEKWKLTRSGYSTLKKISTENTKTVNDTSCSSSDKSKTLLSDEQRFLFKSSMIDFLDKFRGLCTKFELNLEKIKCFDFRKELHYLENAEDISHKVMNLVNNLKIDLKQESKNLSHFHHTWSESNNVREVNDQEGDVEVNEKSDHKQKKKKEAEIQEVQDKLSSSDDPEFSVEKPNNEGENENGEKKQGNISECDADAIFSETEDDNNKESSTQGSQGDVRTLNETENRKQSVSSEDKGSVSPVLTSYKERQQKRTNTKNPLSVIAEELATDRENNIENKTEIPAETSKTKSSFDLTQDSHELSDANESLVDLFDASGDTESIIPSTPNQDKTSKSEMTDKAPEEEVKECSTEETVPVTNNETEVLSTSVDEEGGKVESDIDLESETSTSSANLSDVKKAVEGVRKKKDSKNDSNLGFSSGELLSEENNDDNLEEAAKHSCLESNSNSSDSFELPQISDGDNSESESKMEEKGNKSPVDTEKIENMKDSESSKQSSDDTASSTSTIGKTKSKRLLFKKLLQKYDTNKQLQMRCNVQLERLPKQIIKLHAKALQRSKQYLEEKRMNSLLDLDKLEKKRIKNVSSSSTPPNKAKRKTKEKESLLDHLHGIENDGNFDCVDEDSVSESDDNSNSMKAKIQTNKALMTMAEETTKENVLNSDSDLEDKIPSDNDDEKKDNKKKQKATTEKQARKKDKSDADQEKDTSKSDWRRDKILTTKFSDSDSDEEIISIARKRKKNDDDDDDEGKAEDLQEDSRKKQRKLRKRGRKRMVLSDSGSEKQDTNTSADSSDSDSSNDKSKNKSKKRGKKISDTDESSGEKKLKRVKRRRIKQMDSESNSNSDVDKKDDNSDRLNSSQGSNTPKGRKNIRKVLKDNKVAEDTKQAAKEEEERLKRIAERQKLYNAVYEASRAGEKKVTELILDFDPDTKKELVSVHKEIVKQLKPHQAEGIRFMWDSCYESLERLKTSTGSGCIIAHCMGLGKTLQVIGFVHTLLTNENVGVKTVMIVTPLSTVLNWINEFNMWLKDTGDLDDIDLYELTRYKKNTERVYMLQSWQKTGGVLVLGYEMFRNLTGTGKNVRKAMKEKILKCLIDPGPDIVICDEGHLLKNTESAISKCMNRVKTLRRIVLTGTPLQNNLIEYHCMVQFVKPSLLGTKKEFLNRFVNPITNGQFDDSTERDVKVMKKRAYVLHKMLKGCVQRFDYSVLTPFLPPKQEYVIFVTLSSVQIQLYRYYLENRARSQRGVGGSLFADFQELQRIWTHPLILQYHAKKVDIANDKKCITSDSEGSLKDFIDDGSDSDTSSSCNNSSQSDDDIQEVKTERTTRSKEVQGSEIKIEEEETENVEENSDNKWWAQYVRPEHLEDLRVSSKLVLLFGILKECEQIGDKLLVFSQSLYSLCLIEEFLQKIDKASAEDEVPEYLNEHRGNWILGADYFRLDGQTSPENRSRWCNLFNRPSNTRARLFLISTKAGGLGINLTAANRVVIFDASWNPSHDVQSIFRIYRFGQVKPCYVYRFLAYGTMEEKIYNRQVTKLSLSCRVVDVQQIERHYTNSALNELYKFEPNLTGQKPTLALPRDRLLAEIFLKYKDVVETYHEHDSLLENKTEEELDDEERKQAWLEYEEEKKGKVMMLNTMHPMQNNVLPNQCNILANLAMTNELENLQLLIQKDYPHATAQQRNMIATRAVIDMYSYVEQQAVHGRAQNIHHATQHVPLILQPQRLVQQQGRTITIGDAGGLHTGQVANVAGTSGLADTNDDDIVEVTTNRAQMPVNVSQTAASNKNQEE